MTEILIIAGRTPSKYQILFYKIVTEKTKKMNKEKKQIFLTERARKTQTDYNLYI